MTAVFMDHLGHAGTDGTKAQNCYINHKYTSAPNLVYDDRTYPARTSN